MFNLLVKKHPSDYKNIPPSKEELDKLVNVVDISKLGIYIDINKNIKSVYWEYVDGVIPYGGISWMVFRYLIDSGLLIIENQYYGYRGGNKIKYVDKDSYYNPYDLNLYRPLISKLVQTGYIESLDKGFGYYKIGKVILRQQKLDQIL
jgi:hypothetical protein